MAMEFWGVEVKAGQSCKVEMEEGRIIHISQAALGEVKKGKGSDSIPLFLEINEKKFVVGSLSSENIPQATFDLVFEKDFELSHGGKSGSVYFCGYSTDNPFTGERDESDDESDSEEDIPQDITENGKVEAKPVEAKPVVAKPAASKGKSAKPESSTKPKVTVSEPKKAESDDSDESDDSEDGSSDDDEDLMDASDGFSGSDDDSDEEEDSSEEEEETPKKKVESSKKRSSDSAVKTPVPTKKAKIVTPQKTDGKKGAHTATPHPSKKTAGKTPATSNSKDKSPKSDGKITCGSCTKTFNTDNALQAHSKAKHAAK